ncbi:methyltransferase [Roseibacillus persicicus]|uniref:methyltransferase n=1 Tax=Roseibacillus persicicus TaxID=454148 RepID=UPI00398B8456
MNHDLLGRWSPGRFLGDLASGRYTENELEAFRCLDAIQFRPRSEAQEQLLRLFFSGESCARESAEEALPTSFDELVDLGILEEKGERVRSHYRIRAYPEGYLAEDFPKRLLDSPEDFVMGVAPTSRMVRKLIPDIEPDSVLDLCCGGGWLGLTEALAGREVTACDLNPRALQIAELNQRLLGGPEVSWRQGAWLEPVAGERFDLIVANPPFVQSPGGSSVALDTPEQENVATALLPQLAEHLNPGGFACMLLDWQFASSDRWQAIPAAAIPDSGVQSLLFEVQRKSPEEYAHHWLGQDPRFQDDDARRPEIRRWVEYYERRKTRGISSGFVILRKCEAGEEFHFEESRGITHFLPQTGEEIGRFFRNQGWLRNHSGSLLDVNFTRVNGIRKTEGAVMGREGWETDTMQITSPACLLYDGHIDPALLRILEAASEGIPVRSVLDELAGMVGADSQAIVPQVEELVRELLIRTLIIPVERKD